MCVVRERYSLSDLYIVVHFVRACLCVRVCRRGWEVKIEREVWLSMVWRVIQQGKLFPSHERPIHRSSYGVTAPVIHSNDPPRPPPFLFMSLYFCLFPFIFLLLLWTCWRERVFLSAHTLTHAIFSSLQLPQSRKSAFCVSLCFVVFNVVSCSNCFRLQRKKQTGILKCEDNILFVRFQCCFRKNILFFISSQFVSMFRQI